MPRKKKRPPPKRSEIPDVPAYFIERSRFIVTKDEIASVTGMNESGLRTVLSRLKLRKRLFSPARGLYVFVPPEYRSWGAVPAEWFVDEMMRHLGRSYYVGLLSAAERHGAFTAPRDEFQVVVDDGVPARDYGRVRLRFISSRRVDRMPVEERPTPTGTMRVATREATVVDLVERPREAGGLPTVTRVLEQLGELDGTTLARLSELRHRSHARRLGWLLEHHSKDTDTRALREVAVPDDGKPTRLDPNGPDLHDVDVRWGIVRNADLT